MDCREAAKVFHDWAINEGLMTNVLDKNVQKVDPQIFGDIIGDAGKLILRSKQIQAIGFNALDGEVIVFTKRVAPKTKRQLALLPTEIDTFKISYRQGVQNEIGGSPSTPHGGPPYTVRTVNNNHFYTCGSSISVGNNREAGTLGCLVRDRNGVMFGLTNNHVSGSCSHAGIGLPIVAPGIFDVAPNGVPPFTIGYHHSALPLISGTPDNVDPKLNHDAAIFNVVSDGAVSSYQGTNYDTPDAAGPLTPNLIVEKVGRTTGHTTGTVISQLFGAHPIMYNVPIYGFSGNVYFEPAYVISGLTDMFSDNGDSGSLITTVTPDGRRIAVGIVVGGMDDGSSPGKKATIALPIEPVLNTFGVTLVTGHNI